MSFVRILGSFVSVLSIMAFATPAFADVLPAPENACQGKNAGAACMVTETGTPYMGVCTTSTCTHFDHLDGGMTTYACQICKGTDGGNTTDAGPHPTTGDAGGVTGTNSSSSCSMAVAKKNASAAAPLLIAGLVPLVLRRRKKR